MPLVRSRPGRAPRVLLLGLLPVAVSACGIASGSDGPAIQVYSARSYGAEQAYERFTEQTGIDVVFHTGNDAELRERLQAEGDDSEADVFMTVDVANLALAAEQGVFRELDSPALEQAVPDDLRDPQGRWFGLSVRARAVIYNTDAVDPAEVTGYASLADPRFRGRLCLRTSTSAYTQSLVASLIANEGEDRAREIVAGWMANDPDIIANDTEIIRTVAAGGCDVGITNHYYLARELAADDDLGVALAWPNQDSTGVHVNISGAGVTRSADSPAEAQRFIEWLATEGQSLFVDGN
ncbi:MAG TPA: extracellular solute-binding protein, partial [Mycobacteriales bacterium]|nr:extracellular solute-binding protein [Mycobacteriales bacterium]